MALSDEVLAFRREVAEFLKSKSSELDPWQYYKDRSGATKLYEELGELGWLSISWPKSDGGEGRSVDFEFALWDEMAYARAAKPPIGAGIVAHSIIDHATPEQKARFLPGVAKGTLSFALGYSEPEAGSDLTGLRTRARREGDAYIVTGEKRWTSDAHHSTYLWLLCRTGTAEQMQRGLTFLIVDLSSPNIEISPIHTLDGHQVNEVRLDEVIVPVDNRIGAENEAWTMAQVALARERHLQIMPGRLRRDLDQFIDWANSSGAAAYDEVVRKLALLQAGVDAVGATAEEIVKAVMAGEDTALMAACQKIVGTALIQEIARYPLEWGDLRQLTEGSAFEFLWRECILESIAGGTNEVMSGMVARRALGLGA